MNDQKNIPLKTLLNAEWILVGGMFFIMISLIVISKIQAFQNQSHLDHCPAPVHPPCIVHIQGAVKKPGVYEVCPGTLLKKILKKSAPLNYADLSGYSEDQRIESSMNITIGLLSEISVTISGLEKDPIQCVVPVGTRVSDLKNYININESEKNTINLFKGRRVLKNGERVDARGKSKKLAE